MLEESKKKLICSIFTSWMENGNQTSYLWWLLYFNKTHPTVASNRKSFMITKSRDFDSNKSSSLKHLIQQWIPLRPYKMLTHFQTSQSPLWISTIMLDKNYVLVIAKFSNVFLCKSSITSKDDSPSWTATSSSASQKIPCTLQNPNAHCQVHNSSTHEPVYSQINQVQALPYEHLFHGCLPTTPPQWTLCCSAILTIQSENGCPIFVSYYWAHQNLEPFFPSIH